MLEDFLQQVKLRADPELLGLEQMDVMETGELTTSDAS